MKPQNCKFAEITVRAKNINLQAYEIRAEMCNVHLSCSYRTPLKYTYCIPFGLTKQCHPLTSTPTPSTHTHKHTHQPRPYYLTFASISPAEEHQWRHVQRSLCSSSRLPATLVSQDSYNYYTSWDIRAKSWTQVMVYRRRQDYTL